MVGKSGSRLYDFKIIHKAIDSNKIIVSANHRCLSICGKRTKKVINKIEDAVGTPVSIKITLRSQLSTMLALLCNWIKIDTKPQCFSIVVVHVVYPARELGKGNIKQMA